MGSTFGQSDRTRGLYESRTLRVIHPAVAGGSLLSESAKTKAKRKAKRKAKSDGTEEKPGDRLERFRASRREGKLKRHKEQIVIKRGKKGKLRRGKSKFANSGTFRPCAADPDGREGQVKFRTTGENTPRKAGAMISNKGLRQKIPLNRFINRNPENPTGPIRPKCRASLAGLLRSRAFPGTTSNYDTAVADKISDLNKKEGGPNLHPHERGAREKRHHGPSGAPKRHPKYGKLSGKEDNKPHTAKKEWGKRYNRPVVKAHGDDAPKKKQTRYTTTTSRGKAKKNEKREAAAKRRGEKLAGVKFQDNKHLTKERVADEGKRQADMFKKRAQAQKVTGKGKKKRRRKH